MIAVIGSFRLPVDNVAKAREALARVVTASRSEAGCVAYTYAEDVIEPGLFRVSEVWETREALTAHFGAPHMKQWQEERAALGMSDRDITAYAISGTEAL